LRRIGFVGELRGGREREKDSEQGCGCLKDSVQVGFIRTARVGTRTWLGLLELRVLELIEWE
jgi:hypothetical protein